MDRLEANRMVIERAVSRRHIFLRNAVGILESVFDIPLSMSDKMELRKYVFEMVDEKIKAPFAVRSMVYDPLEKYLLISCPYLDYDHLNNALERLPKKLPPRELLTQIRENHFRWNQ